MVEDGSQSTSLAEWIRTWLAIILAWTGVAGGFFAWSVIRIWNAARDWSASKTADMDNARAIATLEKGLAQHLKEAKELFDRMSSNVHQLQHEVDLKPDRGTLDKAIDRVEGELATMRTDVQTQIVTLRSDVSNGFAGLHHALSALRKQ